MKPKEKNRETRKSKEWIGLIAKHHSILNFRGWPTTKLTDGMS